MADKEKFLADTRDILREKTFRNEKWLNAFSQDLWYVKDYLRGYFAGASRPKGKWADVEIPINKTFKWHAWECTNCREISTLAVELKWKYCPHCGADMRVDLAENVK